MRPSTTPLMSRVQGSGMKCTLCGVTGGYGVEAAPKATQICPKMAPYDLKSAQSAPKATPKGPKICPKMAPNPSEVPQMTHIHPKRLPSRWGFPPPAPSNEGILPQKKHQQRL